MKTLIVIPARYASTRFPGKPLVKIAGKEMLLHTWEVAQKVQKNQPDVEAIVAIDDRRIEDFCRAHNIKYMMTSKSCTTGTERTAEVVSNLDQSPDFIVNLQGDNPLCPPWFIEDMILCFQKDSQDIAVITPYVTLDWKALDRLRDQKSSKPFSGTTVITDGSDNAIWFSKQILPSIRNEHILQTQQKLSPVKRHIGLYGYTPQALEKIANLNETNYSKLEGLEQLSILEAGISIKMVEVDYRGREGMSGIDSPEDVVIAERIILEMKG